MYQTNLLDEIIVDNFAGGGGASTGIELAAGRPVTIAINHDPDAILMHMTNHPYTEHYQASIWDVDPKEKCRGRKVGLAWFSPDCKHFSKAKGGKPVDKNIRGLAWIVLRWAGSVKPRVIILENVEEFQTWGPVRKGRPVKSKQGETFDKWISQLEALGYTIEYRKLRACDYGAPTIRKRFFLIARCDGKPIVWPEPTHGDPNSDEVKSGKLKPWRTAADCIDFDLPCPSIFERKKPLAVNTQRRIARGLDKFVIKDSKPCETSKGEVRGQKLHEPIFTVDGSNRYGLQIPFLTKYYSGAEQSFGCHSPIHTITTKDRMSVCTNYLTILRHNMDCRSVQEPLNTITTSGAHFANTRVYIRKYSEGCSLGYWSKVRELLNRYTEWELADDEILIFNIKGVEYYISDIGLRMLQPKELYRAQGFPDDYIIDHDYTGKSYPKSKQVARCGNAVPPAFAKALVEANLPKWCNKNISSMHELNNQIAV